MNIEHIDNRVLTPRERAADIYNAMQELICTANRLSESNSTAKSAQQCAAAAVYNIISAIKQFHNGAEWKLAETMAWTYWNRVADEVLLINN